MASENAKSLVEKITTIGIFHRTFQPGILPITAEPNDIGQQKFWNPSLISFLRYGQSQINFNLIL